MTIPFVTSGALGVNLSAVYSPDSDLYPYVTDNQQFKLGQQVTASDNSVWIYVKYGTGGSTGLGYVMVFDEDFLAVMLSTDNDVYGGKAGVSPAAALINDYGWIQIYGVCDDIRCEQDALADAPLGPTATAGQLDDAAATGLYVRDLILTTARGGTDGNAPGYLNYPVVETRWEPED